MRRYLPLVGGFLFNLGVGYIYSIANATLYVHSAMCQLGRVVPRSYVSAVYLVVPTLLGLLSFLSGILQRRYGTRTVALIGGAGMSTALFVTQYTFSSFPTYLLTQGILFGLFAAISFSCAVANAYAWWPQHKSIVAGLVMTGTAASPLVFSSLQSHTVNPYDFKPVWSETCGDKVYEYESLMTLLPEMYRRLAAVLFAICVVGALLMSPPPPVDARSVANVVELADPKKRGNSTHSEPAQPALDDVSLFPSEAYRLPQFWVLWCCTLVGSLCGTFAVERWKIIGVSVFDIPDSRISSYGVWATVLGNMLGRTFFGYLSSLQSFKTALAQSAAGSAAAMACIGVLTLYSASSVTEPLFYVTCFFSFLCLSGNFSLIPVSVAEMFGSADFATIYGLVYTSRSASNVAIASVYGILRSTTITTHCFVFAGISVCTVAMVRYLDAQAPKLWKSRQMKRKYN